MKPAMTMLVCVLAVGLASAQSPSIIQNTRNTMNAVQANSAAASNAALGIQEQGPAAAPTATGSVTGVISVKRSPMNAAKTKGSKMHAAGIHKEKVPPAAVEVKTTAPVPGTAARSGPSGDDSAEAEDPAGSEKKYNPNGRRDPFISPVVSHAGGSGCSTGKKCLEIGTISLQGVVRSDTGFIAVVSNGLNKAYFLRENDPVFNGYVVKITGDSIVFQETLQDRLGKTFTREVVKKITTPAV
ncbi:MAG: hypothetical protein WCC04_20880 [Terriglobales bacterium]